MSERKVLPFPVTHAELMRLSVQAFDRQDYATAKELTDMAKAQRLRQRYAAMAQQDPNAEGW